ncbi:1522_t:CDS:1, partial [Cetraspora pellucida]
TNKEKYITYLPHGGFNNQRVELENAIFLAWFLNRTLIIPPIILFEGSANFIFLRYDDLYNVLSQFILSSRNQFQICIKNNPKSGPLGLLFREEQKGCPMVTYSMYDWDELIDFTFLKLHIKHINRQDFNYKNLLESLHIYNNTEVYNMTKDEYPYQQRYYDDATSTIGLDIFKERVNLIDLSKRSEKLLHFGSVYPATRIVRQLPESNEFWNKLMNKALPNNPTLINITDKIVDKIGGIDNFIGIHARLKDGRYLRNQKETVQNLIKRIEKDFKDGVCLKTTIFLATDMKRDHISLQPFFQKFSSCTYILDDFKDLLEPLKFLKNPRDGIIMYEFLIPLVDLLVVSKGNKFYGTKNSTFSSYAQRLHKTWIN